MECEVLFLGFGPITLEFVKKLTSNGHKVIIVSDRSSPTDNKGVYPFELFQTISWSDVLKHEIKCQSTYICWRQSPKNRILGRELLNWVKSEKLKTKKIHHLSSASVYKGNQAIFAEGDYDSRKSSSNLNLKQELEKLVLDIYQSKCTAFINYRISNVIGTGLTRGFIPESLQNIKVNQPIRIYKKFDLVRDYLFIEDLVGALYDLRLNKGHDEVLNISTGHGVAISEVVKYIELSINKELELVEIEAPLGTLPRSVLSCNKLEEYITWKPQPLCMNLDMLVQACV